MNWSPDDWARLGRALRTARAHQGLTQQDLGAMANVSGRSVQEAEAGKVPKARMPYTVPSIARALGWPEGKVEELLDEDEAAQPEGETRLRARAEAQLLTERLQRLTAAQRAAVLGLLDAFEAGA